VVVMMMIVVEEGQTDVVATVVDSLPVGLTA
jgi:hypothetical protein